MEGHNKAHIFPTGDRRQEFKSSLKQESVAVIVTIHVMNVTGYKLHVCHVTNVM